MNRSTRASGTWAAPFDVVVMCVHAASTLPSAGWSRPSDHKKLGPRTAADAIKPGTATRQASLSLGQPARMRARGLAEADMPIPRAPDSPATAALRATAIDQGRGRIGARSTSASRPHEPKSGASTLVPKAADGGDSTNTWSGVSD